MATLANYSPEDVIILIAGVVQLTGFSDGTFISIQKDIPVYTTRESADGYVSRVHRPSSTYTAQITLASTSSSNDVLSILARADQITQQAKFPMIIKDMSGNSLLFALSCWIEGVPDNEFGTEISDRVWKFKCAQATMHWGGNEERGNILNDLLSASAGGIADAGLVQGVPIV